MVTNAARNEAMGKNTILQVPQGLKLSPQQINNIKKTLFTENDETEEKEQDSLLDNELVITETKDDVQGCYQRRAQSFYDGFLYLVKALEMKHGNTKNFQSWSELHKISFPQKGKLEEYEAVMSNYSNYLINQAMLCFGFTKNQAIENINKAEQYVIMARGRPNLASLIPYDVYNEGDFILLSDKQLFPMADQTLKELEQINFSQLKTTPQWFRELPVYQQIYLSYAPSNRSLLDFNTLHLQLTVNKVSLYQHKQKILENLQDHELPDWFKGMSLTHKQVAQAILAEPVNSLESCLDSLKAIRTSIINEKHHELDVIKKLPYWFLCLSEVEQKLLTHTLANAATVRDAVSFIPSRLRTLIGLGNFGYSEIFILNKEGRALKVSPKQWRSTHIASRDVREHPAMVGDLHTERNLDLLLKFMLKLLPDSTEEARIFLQTLITPIKYMELLTSLPDYYLQKQRQKADNNAAAKQGLIIYETNHPLNSGSMYLPTTPNDLGCKNFLSYAKECLQAYQWEDKADIKNLIEKYESVLNSGLGTSTIWDKNGREMFISAYEALISFKLNIPFHSSCVSGKDRRGLLLLHIAAMWIFHEKYNIWPGFEDTGAIREAFVDLFVKLYNLFYIQIHAESNGPGAQGTKTPRNYLAPDIVKKIEEQRPGAMNRDEKLATIIDFSKCIKYSGTSLCVYRDAAAKLSNNSCNELLSNLQVLIGEDKTWETKVIKINLWQSDVPKGINQFKTVLNDPTKSNYEKLAGIYQIAEERLQKTKLRNSATKEIYTTLKELYKSPNPKLEVLNTIDKLKTIKADFFEENKQRSNVFT